MSNCFKVNGEKSKVYDIPNKKGMSKVVVATGFKICGREINPNFSDVVIVKLYAKTFSCGCSVEVFDHGIKVASSYVTLWQLRNKYDVRRECKAMAKAFKKAGIIVTPKKEGCFADETLFNARTYMDIVKSVGRRYSYEDECVIVRRYY